MMASLTKVSLAALALSSAVSAGSLADIDHVVLFMQENRAFDHYFGTMAGVRGFKDPNVKVNGNRPVWYQQVNAKLSTATDYLLPWYLNYLGGSWQQATQCMSAGSNGWSANQGALANGTNDQWAIANTPWSWGHFTRKEIPNHFAIAEGWAVGDMYAESVIASTNPNRVTWMSGTINAPGSAPGLGQGGMYIDNNNSPGCEGTNLNCYPLKWQTTAETYENAGVSWQVYQDTDNFDDNALVHFENFQKAAKGSNLQKKGLAFLGLEQFYKDAAAGVLPAVSIIVGPAELSEHPPYQPKDGGWLQQRIVNAVTSSPKYSKTVLMISYDETGGWGDHVLPFTSPRGTSGEWVKDPYGSSDVPTGPGFRLPFYIISPWTRGGNVFVEPSDHNSQILFVEKWLAAKGKSVKTSAMNAWRRSHMADLTRAFDFANPDFSIPNMPNISYPSTDKPGGQWNGYSVCENTYATRRPPVPYGKQSPNDAPGQTEEGFKKMRGNPTEGRYLTFESNGYALTNGGSGSLTTSAATSSHSSKAQRFVLYASNPDASVLQQFAIASAVDNSTISGTSFVRSGGSSAALYTIRDLGNGAGYTVQASGGSQQYLVADGSGRLSLSSTAPTKGWTVYSVTYNN